MQKSSDLYKVTLYFSCHDLADLDGIGKSDPYIEATYDNAKVGRTETIQNNLNPTFRIGISGEFNVNHKLSFTVYDDDGDKSQSIGTVEGKVSELVQVHGQEIIYSLEDNQKRSRGKLHVRCFVWGKPDHLLKMEWSGKDILDVETFSKSDPFLKFYKVGKNGDWELTHQTEQVLDNLNPKFAAFEMLDSAFYDLDVDKRLKVECWDFEKSGKHRIIGDCQCSFKELAEKRELELWSSAKNKKAGILSVALSGRKK